MLAFRPGGIAEGPADSSADKDAQYWWLLPGDLGYCAAPPANPKSR
jgi:hypothetical protein